MAYIGRYINMDRSTERRRKLETMFAALGCADRYTRFAAIDGRTLDRPRSPLTPGECGCFQSHYQCIKESMDEDVHVHVVEDDVVFGPRTLPILDQIIEDALGHGELTYTDIFVPGDLSSMVQLMNYYRLSGVLDGRADGGVKQLKYVNYFNLKHGSFTAASSYIVRSDARAKLLRLMEAELAAGPTVAVDMFYNRIVHAGDVTAVVMLPFLTSVDPAAVLSTTIHGRAQDARSNLAFFMLRNYFFLDKDDQALEQMGRELSAEMEDPNYMDTLLEVFRFIFSKDFVPI